MQMGSLLGLLGPHRTRNQRTFWCAFVILSAVCITYAVLGQFLESEVLFQFIGKVANEVEGYVKDISGNRPWSTATGELQDEQLEALTDSGIEHSGEDNVLESPEDSWGIHNPPVKAPPKGQTRPPLDVTHQEQVASHHDEAPLGTPKTNGGTHLKYKPSEQQFNAANHVQPDPYTLTTFKEAWLANEIGGPLNSTVLAPISSLCASVTWKYDIVLSMVPPGVGIGNSRVPILDFIYFAMQTGSHFILPSSIKGNDGTKDGLGASNGAHPFSHLFDVEFLISTLADACPQMRVFRTAVEAGVNAKITQEFDTKSFRTDKIAYTNPTALTARLRDWIDSRPEGYQDGAVNMVPVRVPFFAHDMRTKPKMRMALGRMIKINPRIRELAAAAIFNLRRSHGLEASIDPSKQLYREAYYGMQIRAEADVGEALGRYEDQKAAHLDLCQKLNLSLIYLTTGNREHAIRFANDANQMGISVISKLDLLNAVEEQATLDSLAFDSMTWEQQAVLEFEILSRSSFFSGPSESSFTWNIALRRAFYIEDERLDRIHAYGANELDPVLVYDDGLSRIMSKSPNPDGVDLVELYAPEGMYP